MRTHRGFPRSGENREIVPLVVSARISRQAVEKPGTVGLSATGQISPGQSRAPSTDPAFRGHIPARIRRYCKTGPRQATSASKRQRFKPRSGTAERGAEPPPRMGLARVSSGVPRGIDAEPNRAHRGAPRCDPPKRGQSPRARPAADEPPKNRRAAHLDAPRSASVGKPSGFLGNSSAHLEGARAAV